MSEKPDPNSLAVFTEEELEAAKLANNPDWKLRTEEVMRDRLETILYSDDPEELEAMTEEGRKFNSEMAERMAGQIDMLYEDGDPKKKTMMGQLKDRIDDSVVEEGRPSDHDFRHEALSGGRDISNNS